MADTDSIERLETSDTNTEVTCSVVVVTYRTPSRDLERMLKSLSNQTVSGFEVVIIDNGGRHGDDLEYAVESYSVVHRYARMEHNCGITAGRNVGVELSRGDPIVFLDDDAIPRRDFVEQHLRAHEREEVIAVRGKVLPRTDNIYNRIQSWYAISDRSVPYYINTEGNSSFDRNAFTRSSGFDEELGGRAGHEGIELTYRLIQEGYPRRSIIYHPEAVIYHDNADSLRAYIHKQVCYRRNARYLREAYPEIFEFTESYERDIDPKRRPERTLDRLTITAINGLIEVFDRAGTNK